MEEGEEEEHRSVLPGLETRTASNLIKSHWRKSTGEGVEPHLRIIYLPRTHWSWRLQTVLSADGWPAPPVHLRGRCHFLSACHGPFSCRQTGVLAGNSLFSFSFNILAFPFNYNWGVSIMLAGSPVVWVLHFVQEVIEFVLVPDWLVDLLSIQVIADVREVFIPLHGDVSHCVSDVLQDQQEHQTTYMYDDCCSYCLEETLNCCYFRYRQITEHL